MSKSEKPVVSTDLALVPTSSLPSSVRSSLEVTKDDLIAVAVSRKETKLLAEKAQHEGEIKTLDQEMSAKRKDLDKAVKPACEAKWGDLIKKANDALKALGLDRDIELCPYLREEEGKLVISTRVSYGCNSNLLTAPAPANIKALHAEIKGLEKKRETVYDKLVTVRKNLSLLPTMERQARAKWAASVISQSPEGRKFLQEFAGD
jgi:hypothetical protein